MYTICICPQYESLGRLRQLLSVPSSQELPVPCLIPGIKPKALSKEQTSEDRPGPFLDDPTPSFENVDRQAPFSFVRLLSAHEAHSVLISFVRPASSHVYIPRMNSC